MSRVTGSARSSRDRPPAGRPRVIVIGAGVAGMAAGCYAQMSGMDTRIFERHVLPGGCCTAWARDGYLFDNCVEWLTGTAPGTPANRIWRELGALDGKEITRFPTFNTVVDPGGRQMAFHTDPDLLERHLLEVSPADAPLIGRFCRDLRAFGDIDLYPLLKPPPLRTPGERLLILRLLLSSFRLLWRTGRTPMHTFAGRFQDPWLGAAFRHLVGQEIAGLPVAAFLVHLAAARTGNAGCPQGGSLGLARSIEDRYARLGGRIDYRARVERVLVERDRAVGVELRDGERHYADHVISACDGRTTIYGMLGGRYTSPEIDRLYACLEDEGEAVYPGKVSVFLGIKGEVAAEAHSVTYLLSPREVAEIPGMRQSALVLQVRSRHFEGVAPPGDTVVHCTYVSDFRYWRTLREQDRKVYWARKREAAERIVEYLERHLPGTAGRVAVSDVSTPTTTLRYTGNARGSILGWSPVSGAEEVMGRLTGRGRMRLPGLAGFSMAGHWVSMGGLIRAASSGRSAVQYLCRELGVPFRAWESDGTEPWHLGRLGPLPRLTRGREPGRAVSG